MDAHDEQLMNCVRVNFAKDEIVTPARLQRKCPIPFYTADNHLEHIVGVDLGDGTKISRRSYKALYKDPPDEDEETTKRLSDEDLGEPEGTCCENFAAGLLVGAITVAVVGLAFWTVSRTREHVHAWVPCQDRESWVHTCQGCGSVQWDLNDPESPIQFLPASN